MRNESNLIIPSGQAFRSCHMQRLYDVAWYCMFPFLYVINTVGCIFKSTTEENYQRYWKRPCYNRMNRCIIMSVGTLFLVCLAILCLPLFGIGLLVRTIIHACDCREKFVHVYDENDRNKKEAYSPTKDPVASFIVVCGNVCLMPYFMSKVNNLSDPQKRADKIGQRLCRDLPLQTEGYPMRSSVSEAEKKLGSAKFPDSGNHEQFVKHNAESEDIEMQIFSSDVSQKHLKNSETNQENNQQYDKFESPKSQSSHENEHETTAFPTSPSPGKHPSSYRFESVSEYFPEEVEFICLQEVFDRRATDRLIKKLKPLQIEGCPMRSSVSEAEKKLGSAKFPDSGNHEQFVKHNAESEDIEMQIFSSDESQKHLKNSETNQENNQQYDKFESPKSQNSHENEHETTAFPTSPSPGKHPSSYRFESVSEYFPEEVEFICLQEVFDRRATDRLIKKLKPRFPYILYDIGVNSWASNFFMLNSGLFFASRYKIMRADFNFFSIGSDRGAAKGLLMVKVYLGSHDGATVVGYIANAHLQAWPGERQSMQRETQLNEIQQWLKEFKKGNLETERNNEIIAFDILCGDFNFDNLSHGDKDNSKHSLMTKDYCDPCCVERDEEREEADWAVGTELKQHKIYRMNSEQDRENLNVIDPAKLKRILEDENTRSKFVESDRDDGRHKGKRRIDYLMYRRENNKIQVEEFHFVTALATLTDHIPLAMKFSVDLRKEENNPLHKKDVSGPSESHPGIQ